MPRLSLILLLVFTVLLAGWILSGKSQDATPIDLSPKMNAPDFPSGLEWLNTDRPLTLNDLRGKVVLIDFWTYCCINCMHIIPDLKRLEAEFPDELVVIGVHSGKFKQEGETDNIRQAILRYEIHHPVINDAKFTVWKSYSARAWPTLVLIDPEGRIVATHSGEGAYATFAEPIRQIAGIYEEEGKLKHGKFETQLEAGSAGDGYLNYPGKVTARKVPGEYLSAFGQSSEGEKRLLFISDQNHNRVVVWDLDARATIGTIGSGEIGFKDGSFAQSSLNHPQGMELMGGKLYIADTENHAIREADLSTGQLSTLAGNGEQALGWGASGGFGSKIALSSPWDLTAKDSILYVAMAGTHQIWTIRLSDGYAEPFAGTSREGLFDSIRSMASLAQPSGLTILNGKLYFADSEVSAIRYVELTGEGRVGTVVGIDLFDFGDKDGVGDNVRLQHPLGITTDGKSLFVADTYNSKIKVIDPARRSSTTFLGTTCGFRDGDKTTAQFYEPGGLCWFEGKLYIADTNNGKIRVVNIQTGLVETLPIESPDKSQSTDDGQASEQPKTVVKTGAGEIQLVFTLPAGLKLNSEAGVSVTVTDPNNLIGGKPLEASFTPDHNTTFSIPITWKSGSGTLRIEAYYVTCGEVDASLCVPGSALLNLPVSVTASGPSTLRVPIKVES